MASAGTRVSASAAFFPADVYSTRRSSTKARIIMRGLRAGVKTPAYQPVPFKLTHYLVHQQLAGAFLAHPPPAKPYNCQSAHDGHQL